MCVVADDIVHHASREASAKCAPVCGTIVYMTLDLGAEGQDKSNPFSPKRNLLSDVIK